jgi:hypothetical protein
MCNLLRVSMKSSRWGLLLDTVCSQCLRFIPTQKTYLCGHQLCSACESQLCPVCTASAQRIHLSPEEWLSQETKYHRFTIIIFVDDANGPSALLNEINEGAISTIREIGGDLFGVVPAVNHDYGWVRTYIDKGSRLYKKHIEMQLRMPGSPAAVVTGNLFGTSPSSPRFLSNSISPRDRRGSGSESPQNETSVGSPMQTSFLKRLTVVGGARMEGITAVVFKKDGKVSLRWDSTMRGKYGDPTTQFLINYVQFYFMRDDPAASVSYYMTQNMSNIFSRVLSVPELRSMFEDHLAREHNLEALQFLGTFYNNT